METQYDHWSKVCGHFGHTPGAGAPTLLGLRGILLLAKYTHQTMHVPAYDDTFILLQRRSS
jgi:hypothetical protein